MLQLQSHILQIENINQQQFSIIFIILGKIMFQVIIFKAISKFVVESLNYFLKFGILSVEIGKSTFQIVSAKAPVMTVK